LRIPKKQWRNECECDSQCRTQYDDRGCAANADACFEGDIARAVARACQQRLEAGTSFIVAAHSTMTGAAPPMLMPARGSFSRLVDRTGNFLAIGDIRVSSLLDIYCDITAISPACGISRN
jgi:hypothetical protein